MRDFMDKVDAVLQLREYSLAAMRGEVGRVLRFQSLEEALTLVRFELHEIDADSSVVLMNTDNIDQAKKRFKDNRYMEDYPTMNRMLGMLVVQSEMIPRNMLILASKQDIALYLSQRGIEL